MYRRCTLSLLLYVHVCVRAYLHSPLLLRIIRAETPLARPSLGEPAGAAFSSELTSAPCCFNKSVSVLEISNNHSGQTSSLMKQLPARHKTQLNLAFSSEETLFNSLFHSQSTSSITFACILHFFFPPSVTYGQNFLQYVHVWTRGLVGLGGRRQNTATAALMHTDKHTLAHISLSGVFFFCKFSFRRFITAAHQSKPRSTLAALSPDTQKQTLPGEIILTATHAFHPLHH